MNVEVHAPGEELEPGDSFVPDSYSVHSAMLSTAEPTSPAFPAVVVELAGWMAAELPLQEGAAREPSVRMRILLEVPGAQGIAAGILNSLGQLQRLAQRRD